MVTPELFGRPVELPALRDLCAHGSNWQLFTAFDPFTPPFKTLLN